MLKRLLAKRKWHDTAHALYVAAVAEARRPEFYRDLGVQDTVDGRFDLITLQVVLVIHRLRQIRDAEPAADAVSQALFDIMFADMDRSLREMGVGDLSVGKRVKAMARAFFGRAEAYEAGLAAPDDALEQALARNLYRGSGPSAEVLKAMADRVRRQVQALEGVSAPDMLAGHAFFGELTG
jgi:cytochrome b pre-mRNA-processing protein 3